MTDFYALWRREEIDGIRKKLNSAENAFSILQDKTTIYARSIIAIADMRRQALAVYENSPESLGETP